MSKVNENKERPIAEWKTRGIWRKDRDRPLPSMEVYYDAGQY